MTTILPTPEEQELIARLVAHFTSHRAKFEMFMPGLKAMAQSDELAPLVHSSKVRLKDAGHLADKLWRKVQKAREEKRPFDITVENLFSRINDLVGLRILHLHTRQMGQIDEVLRGLLRAEFGYEVRECFARTWDDESRRYFRSIGIRTEESGENMYTSVHYVIDLRTEAQRTAEIQVRTLAEELWGEVDHTINYPAKSETLACREQLSVLARATSTCTRLVDSIFLTHEEAKTIRAGASGAS